MAKTDCPNKIRVVLAEKEVTGHWLATQMGVTDITVSRWKTLITFKAHHPICCLCT